MDCNLLSHRVDASQCSVEVNYVYTVFNEGTTTMDINFFDRFRNGEIVNLLEANTMFASIPPGGTYELTEVEEIDLCSDVLTYETHVVLETGSDQSFEFCLAEDTYSIALLFVRHL